MLSITDGISLMLTNFQKKQVDTFFNKLSNLQAGHPLINVT